MSEPEAQRSTPSVALIVALVVAGLVAGSGALHSRMLALIAAAEPLIARHPVAGPLVFAALAVLSALLLFFSSVVLVPLGVQAWGTPACVLLLWGGWVIGSIGTYALGRWLGRGVVERFASPARLAAFERHLTEKRSFWAALVIQLVLQSDVAGYVFGLVRYPLPAFLGAIAVAEAMFAVATVFLGAAFVRGQSMVLLGVAALVLLIVAFRRWPWWVGRRAPRRRAGSNADSVADATTSP